MVMMIGDRQAGACHRRLIVVAHIVFDGLLGCIVHNGG